MYCGIYKLFFSLQQQASCFGFVEFESASSMQGALEVFACYYLYACLLVFG